MTLTGADKILIASKGFEACQTGQAFIGRKIFSALLLAEPGHPACRIGMAFSHIVVGEQLEAVEILLSVLTENPDDIEARAYLGMALMLGGQGDQAKVELEKVEGASPLAQDLLNEMKQADYLGF